MWLWSPRSPTICHLLSGKPGRSVVQLGLSTKTWAFWGKWRRFWSESESPRTRNVDVCEQKQGKSRERENALPLPFCSDQALSGLHGGHLHWWGPSLFSLLIHALMSSKDTLSDTPRNNILPAIWASLSLVKWTREINHHSSFITLINGFPRAWKRSCLKRVFPKTHSSNQKDR